MIQTFNSFTLGGIVSSEKGLIVNEKKTYNAPERDVDFIEVPGRNGALIKDNKRFKNVRIEYNCYVMPDWELSMTCRAVKAWLYGNLAYRILKDTYDKYYFRKATYKGEYDLEEWAYEIGYVPIQFECKPEKWSYAGQAKTVLTAEGTMRNPEAFEARPLIRVYGSGAGTLVIGDYSIAITAIDEYIDIDCDIQDAFKGEANLNEAIETDEFPILQPGTSAISWTGLITNIEITPRWWTL